MVYKYGVVIVVVQNENYLKNCFTLHIYRIACRVNCAPILPSFYIRVKKKKIYKNPKYIPKYTEQILSEG